MARQYGLTRTQAAQLVAWASASETGNLLTARQTRVLLLRYARSGAVLRTLAQAGDVLGVSRERVRHIEAKAYERFCACERERRIAQALELRVKELRVTRLVRKALTAAGITHVRQVAAMSSQELVAELGYPTGRRALRQIRSALQEIGLTLAPSRYADGQVQSLGLSRPTLALLETLGLHSVSALLEMSGVDLELHLKRASQDVITEVRDALYERGLSLKGEEERDDLRVPTAMESLQLPQRAYGALKRAGYSTVEEIEELSDEELLGRVPQVGVQSLAATRHAIALFRHGAPE